MSQLEKEEEEVAVCVSDPRERGIGHTKYPGLKRTTGLNGRWFNGRLPRPRATASLAWALALAIKVVTINYSHR